MTKKRSIIDRAFTAARYWVGKRGYLGYVEGREDHIAYRCGWAAGYAAARKELAQGKSKVSIS